jgi:CRP-like cAMP-binding protein
MPSLFDYPTGENRSVATTPQYLLSGGSDRDWATLNRYTLNRRFRAGEIVIGEGDSDRALYIVTDGVLEAVLPGRKNRRLSTFEAGSVIGELSFFDGGPRSAQVRAVTDAELAMLTLDSFNTLAAGHPALARMLLFDLGRILAGRLRSVQGAGS